MRPTILLSLGLAASLGCGQTRFNTVKNDNPPPASGAPPSAAQLVAYLNDNAGRIQSLKADDLWITITADREKFDVSGKMMAQKNKNFRLKAKALGNEVVDLGSNEDEFWYWISKSPQPYQFFCAYKDLAAGRVRQMPFPFQPEWILETMGLGPYSSADRLQVEADPNTLKLVERTRSPQGNPVRKVIVFQRQEVQAPRPQVLAFQLIDETTLKEICSAHISEAQWVGPMKATIPRKMELRWPEANVTLAMKLDGIAVNPPLPPAAFIRQKMNGVQAFDLARGLVTEGPVQQLQSRSR